jgi:hypothetical protein
LKEILVDFLNLLNKKRYRHSLVFSVSDHVQAAEMKFMRTGKDCNHIHETKIYDVMNYKYSKSLKKKCRSQ